MTASRHGSADVFPGWFPWVLATLAVATVLLGIRGYSLYESDHQKMPKQSPGSEQPHAQPKKDSPPAEGLDRWSMLYHSLQLLIGHGQHMEPPRLRWQMHVARILGVLVIFLAGMWAFVQFFREKARLFVLRVRGAAESRGDLRTG